MQQFYKIFTGTFAFYMVLQFFLCLGGRAEALERKSILWNGERRLYFCLFRPDQPGLTLSGVLTYS